MEASSPREVRARRPPKARVDPRRPLGVVVEDEPEPPRRAGEPPRTVAAATVFLAGAECPFTCVFCDLWRHTLDGPTPPGAIPAQLELARAEIARARDPAGVRAIKLYNASNFFEPRAVPDADREPILEQIAAFERVVVESHPRLLGERADWWATRLKARLEVAIGLETVHPEASRRLNKGATLEDSEQAARRLQELGVGLRCFVLVGVPYIGEEEQAEWVARSVERAAVLGARAASLIPVRGGNGELERLRASGAWQPPTLDLFEDCVDAAMACDDGPNGGLVVQADPWDLETFADCERCSHARVERLRRVNALGAQGVSLPRVECDACGSAR